MADYSDWAKPLQYRTARYPECELCPEWRPTGRDRPEWCLLDRRPSGKTCEACRAAGDSFQALKPRLWTERPIGTTTNVGGGPFDHRSYDLTADGKRIITWDTDEVRNVAKTNLHITVLTNWFGEVERRFAHGGR